MKPTRFARRFARVVAALVALVAVTLGSAFAQAVDLPNKKDPIHGITTSGQPSAEQLAAAAAAGYKTVIDLRAANEERDMDEKSLVEQLGMTYISLPINGAAGVTFSNAATLDELLNKAERPVLLHCTSGNRAGALLALRAKLDGADNQSALELGLAGGVTGMKPVVEEKLAQGHD